ncbi:MAG: hypothetical protein MH825_01590 [Cyanobacteria bacterium]|nr:hypothetical protein [Cyanobacteriota bacterium]
MNLPQIASDLGMRPGMPEAMRWRPLAALSRRPPSTPNAPPLYHPATAAHGATAIAPGPPPR